MQRDDWHAPKRNRYFTGKLMSAQDFADEQDYHRDKQRRHNRLLHGYGVASGLEVTTRGGQVRLLPGLAIDGDGEEIVVPEAIDLAMPCAGRVAFLVLRYAERATDPVPVAGAESDGSEYSRVEETYTLAFEARDPRHGARRADAKPAAIALACLRRARGHWRVDAAFRRARAR